MARSLGAVLFTDMVGSTELLGELGTAGAIALRRSVDDLLEGAVDRHEGTVVDTNGDGHVARFATGTAALAAAAEIQQAASPEGVASRARVRLRIGLSAGELDEIEGRPVGTPVNEAAKLERACRPGRVLASETLLDLLPEVPASLVIGAAVDVAGDLVAHEIRNVQTTRADLQGRQ